jgi:hypothetical protein
MNSIRICNNYECLHYTDVKKACGNSVYDANNTFPILCNQIAVVTLKTPANSTVLQIKLLKLLRLLRIFFAVE